MSKRFPGFRLQLLAIVLVAALCPQAQQPSVSWQGNLAVISWTETLAAPSVPAGAVPFSVFTGPYLVWLTDSNAVVRWQTAATLSLRTNPYGYNGTLSSSDFRFYKINLSGLKPDTDYRYYLTSTNGGWTYKGDTCVFRTFPSDTATSFRFGIMGDTRGSGIRPLFVSLNEFRPLFFSDNGDIASGSWGYNLDTLTPPPKDWFRVFYNLREAMSYAPMMPSMGNWDVSINADFDVNWVKHYFDGIPAGSNAAGPARPPYYYSFDVGQVHFVHLCTELKSANSIAAGDSVNYHEFTRAQQLAWLREDLKNSGKKWKVVSQHDPSNPFWISDLLKTYNVQLLVTASAHAYARGKRSFFGSGEHEITFSDSGTAQLLSGGAGATLSLSSIFNAEQHRSVYHYVRVQVHGDEMFFEAVDSNRTIIDAWRLPLIGQPETLPSSDIQDRLLTAPGRTRLTASPNPFNPWVQIKYRGQTRPGRHPIVEIFNASGRRLHAAKSSLRELEQGFTWDAAGYPAGTYIVRLTLDGKVISGRMALIK